METNKYNGIDFHHNVGYVTYSFKVGHVGSADRCPDETQVVDACFVGSVLVVLNEHLPHKFIHTLNIT